MIYYLHLKLCVLVDEFVVIPSNHCITHQHSPVLDERSENER